MNEFPRLKTGAVAQYPAEKTISCPTHVLRFVDGSEQRCREFTTPLRKWVIRLDLLDDGEMTDLEQFFIAQQGELGDFAFVNPWDGVEYESCSLEGGDIALEYALYGQGETTLTVRENRR